MADTDGAATTRTLLIADGDVTSRQALVDHLSEGDEYAVESADSGRAVLDRLGAAPVDVLVASIRLPDMEGAQIVREALALDRDLAIVIMNDLVDASSAARCLQMGACSYLNRPVILSELTAAVEQGLLFRDDLAGGAAKGSTAEDAARSDSEALRVRHELERVITGTLEVMMTTIEAKDATMLGHSQRVAALSATVADEMGLDDQDVEEIRLAGRFHDLGKIGIPEELLSKRDSPTEDELRQVRQHAAIGGDILGAIEHLGLVPRYVRSHHEHWDGSGYPDGLAGKDIPIGGRILCAVEVFDALTTPGTNREPLSPIDAVRRMMALDGTVLDPDVLFALANAVANQRTLPFLSEPDQRLNASGIVMIPKSED